MNTIGNNLSKTPKKPLFTKQASKSSTGSKGNSITLQWIADQLSDEYVDSDGKTRPKHYKTEY